MQFYELHYPTVHLNIHLGLYWMTLHLFSVLSYSTNIEPLE